MSDLLYTGVWGKKYLALFCWALWSNAWYCYTVVFSYCVLCFPLMWPRQLIVGCDKQFGWHICIPPQLSSLCLSVCLSAVCLCLCLSLSLSPKHWNWKCLDGRIATRLQDKCRIARGYPTRMVFTPNLETMGHRNSSPNRRPQTTKWSTTLMDLHTSQIDVHDEGF